MPVLESLDPQSQQVFQRLNVSRETLSLLSIYAHAVRDGQARGNLVSRRSLGHIWSRHIADSAQVLLHAGNARTWIDVGSGAGFPGLVVAILLRNRPGCRFHLIDSNQRKGNFLQGVVDRLNLTSNIHIERVERMYSLDGESPAYVSARAVAPLKRMVSLTRPWLKRGMVGVWHVGESAQEEIYQLSARKELSVEANRSLTGPGNIVRVQWRRH